MKQKHVLISIDKNKFNIDKLEQVKDSFYRQYQTLLHSVENSENKCEFMVEDLEGLSHIKTEMRGFILGSFQN